MSAAGASSELRRLGDRRADDEPSATERASPAVTHAAGQFIIAVR